MERFSDYNPPLPKNKKIKEDKLQIRIHQPSVKFVFVFFILLITVYRILSCNNFTNMPFTTCNNIGNVILDLFRTKLDSVYPNVNESNQKQTCEDICLSNSIGLGSSALLCNTNMSHYDQ